MARDVNKVILIGNLTHEPQLRKTSSGQSVCVFRIATKRVWTNRAGEKQDESQYHRIVAWGALAEICGKYLKKGRRVFVEGRLSSRGYEKAGEKRTLVEVVIDDMILLDAKPSEGPSEAAVAVASSLGRVIDEESPSEIPF